MSDMLEFSLSVLAETWAVLAEAAPWLLVGFLIAGLLKVFVPAHLIARQLGGNNLRSVVLAALYGAPIPLCSCSVIPTASALRSAGASKGATTSFLISTPETGVDSVSVTYALLDPWMTLMRPVFALVTAVLTGNAVNLLTRRELLEADAGAAGAEVTGEASVEVPEAAGCCGDTPKCGPGEEEHSRTEEKQAQELSLPKRAVTGVRYAFVDLLDDLTPVLVIGLLLSGMIATLVPTDFFSETVPNGMPAMLLMLLLGTPLYVCATASTPIAAALIAKGLDPGAALVFLLVGPATNITTLLVVGRMLGRKVLVTYLVGVIGISLLAGLGANWLYARLGIDLGAVVSAGLHEHAGVLSILCAVLLLLLLAWSAVRIRLDRILMGWARKALGWLRPQKSGGSGGSINAGLLLIYCALLWVGTGACLTTEQTLPSNSGARSVRRAIATQAWEVFLDGESFGRVIRFDVEGWPQDTRFVIQNPFGQDLGMVDSLGRAYRYVPHREPLWVGSGMVAEGTALVLNLTGTLELQEVAIEESPQQQIGVSRGPEVPGEEH